MNNSMSLRDAKPVVQQRFFSRVYGFMVLALAISGVAAFFVANNVGIQRVIFGNQLVFFGLIIGELVLVFILSAQIQSMSRQTATLLFIAYSIVNGLTLSAVFLVYTSSSIASIFLISALMFGGMSLYGLKTKSDLNSAGRYLIMGLIGVIIASVVNMLLRSSTLNWLISILTVVIFTGLTAYDTQKLLNISKYDDGSENFQKVAIIGALQLYLDFINIFLALLRLFGNRRS